MNATPTNPFLYPKTYIKKGCNNYDIYYYSNENVNEWIYDENCKYSDIPKKCEDYNELSKANFNLVLNPESRHAAQDMQ